MLDARRFNGEEDRWCRSEAPPMIARWVVLIGLRVEPESASSSARSLSTERSVEAAQGELAVDEL
jgi:hypothetical protein